MKKKKVDEIDIAILNLLMEDSWRSNKEISEALELSQPATLNRVQNLRKRGFIRYKGIQIDVTGINGSCWGVAVLINSLWKIINFSGDRA